jgi:glycosyltransferase involved in cell wall biosynthesis
MFGRTMEAEETIVVSIVMPAYNEAGNIEKTVTDCVDMLQREQIPGEVIVTNDGSTDDTLSILKKLKERYENFRYIDLEQNLGYGGALSHAIDQSRGTYVVTNDSDGQFDIGDVPRLLEKIQEGYDCVTGYRAKKKDTLPRVFANWGYNMLVKMLCGINFRDAQCALKIFKGDIIRELPMEARGFTFPTETLIKLNYQGCGMAEIPITHHFREAGESKVKFFRTVRIMFTFLLYIRFKLALHKSKVIYRL